MSEELFKRYKIKAKKALGQNFLVNDGIINEIANIIDTEDKSIIEVGPGYGALTQKLLNQNLESLTLVELDKRMVEILEDRIKRGELKSENTDFSIENNDVLQFTPKYNKYSVIANIPYYITSPILRYFLYSLEKSPDEMVILMQKDVGDKIIDTQSEGKKRKSSVIGLMMAKKCYASEKLTVSNQNFIPAPQVESSVLLFETHDLYAQIDDEEFLKYIKMGFSSARKKLIKNLVNGGVEKKAALAAFDTLEINENVRGDALDIKQWTDLVRELMSIG